MPLYLCITYTFSSRLQPSLLLHIILQIQLFLSIIAKPRDRDILAHKLGVGAISHYAILGIEECYSGICERLAWKLAKARPIGTCLSW